MITPSRASFFFAAAVAVCLAVLAALVAWPLNPESPAPEGDAPDVSVAARVTRAGFTEGDIRVILGQPAAIKADGAAAIYEYRGVNCAIDPTSMVPIIIRTDSPESHDIDVIFTRGFVSAWRVLR